MSEPESTVKLFKILTGDSFIESILILLITALITGLLVPFIKARIDDSNFRKRKNFEAAVARQAKVIEYKSSLLDDLAHALWRYQFLVLEPTYYKMRKNETGYQAAFSEYDKNAPIILNQIRETVSKIRRFSTPEIYHSFKTLFHDDLIMIDSWLIELEETGQSQKGDWAVHHRYVYSDLGNVIDKLLYELASNLGFSDQPQSKDISA